MQERIVEIILFLVSELKSNKQLNDVDVSLLTESGYTQTEISTAFSWLFERMSLGQELVAKDQRHQPFSPCSARSRENGHYA